MNNVILIGRLTRDPELRYMLDAKKTVATFNLAVNRVNQKGKADFFRIVVFGNYAENCKKHLSKGSQVCIQGRIQNNNYTTGNGEKRYGTDIIADRVEFLDSKNKNNESQETEDDNLPDGFQALDDDDEIPF